ncbi:MAG: formate/nitrite transporter family protein [Acidobacteriota bacterium]
MNQDESPKATSTIGDDEMPKTERQQERSHEDQKFVPVIIKRTDEARRHPDDILQMAIEEGLEQLERPPLSLFLSAVSAGLILGFTAMAVGVMASVVTNLDSEPLQRLAIALVYPFGFVVCLMSGTELFTEHTATAVYPVLDQRSRLWRLFRLWFLVGIGNLLGAAAVAWLLVRAEPVIGARQGYLYIGRHLVEPSLLPLLVSAVLAGSLMALGAWLILATPPTVSQLFSIYIVTFLIGLGGLHHSIAGAAEIFTAYLIGSELTMPEVVRFVGVALLGNLIGGSLFVAGLNYAHIRQSRQSQ